METAAPTADTIIAHDGTSDTAASNPEVLVDEELLIEEISIDGMCGVY